jgi:signal transduction histidine kinase
LIQWVLNRKWLPEIVFGLSSLAFVVSDLAIQGNQTLLPAALLALSLIVFRRFTLIQPLLILAGSITEVLSGIQPLVSGMVAPVALFLTAAFGLRRFGVYSLIASGLSGLFIAWNTALNSSIVKDIYGIHVYDDTGRWAAFIFAGVTVLGVNGFAWLAGAYWVERFRQKTASMERDEVKAANLRTRLDIAEQNHRFSIARDLNELILQRVSGILTLTDGARYAAKLDAELAPRTLERLAVLQREVHNEMRRLFDMLNMSVQVATAPPTIRDLDFLAAQYRDLGYPTVILHRGPRVQVSPGAGLNIYRIVFEALENIKNHAPIGTSIDIDFNWSASGLQILVKDNGVETEAKSGLGLEESPYQVQDDIDALTQEVTGAGITGMRERAQLFGGNVEAKIVPGIGFTINAIFPSIDDLTAGQE